MEKPKVIVIEGPTASGKTALSIELAKKINGEIVSADSMQIYQEMNIGTAKPDEKEKQGISHYVMDCIKPNERFSVAQYQKEAKKAIQTILEKGKIPIVVGGTGLYIDALLYEITYPEIETDLFYRKTLEERVEIEGLEDLYKEARQIDPDAMQKISKNDQKRIMRVLEIYHQTGKTKTQLEKESRSEQIPYDYHVFAIRWEREELYSRINQRVDNMIEKGLIAEVQALCQKYKQFPTALQGLGYKEVQAYLQGKATKEEMIEILKRETRRYAKRQMTWFRKNKQVIWLVGGSQNIQDNIAIILEDVYSERR